MARLIELRVLKFLVNSYKLVKNWRVLVSNIAGFNIFDDPTFFSLVPGLDFKSKAATFASSFAPKFEALITLLSWNHPSAQNIAHKKAKTKPWRIFADFFIKNTMF